MGKKVLAPVVLTVLVLACAACAPAEEPPLADEGDGYVALPEERPPVELVTDAREAATDLGGHLISRLVEEMNRGTSAEALAVCTDEAQKAAEERSKDGMTVRRVSLEVRNPADEPDPYERRKLEEMAALHAADELPGELVEIVAHEGERELRYMRPLKMMGPCLSCHGPRDSLDPEVVRFLDERYPRDEATGYQAGDLRGAISVVVKLERPTPTGG